MEAVREIRKVCSADCTRAGAESFLAGMTAVLVDTQDLAEREASTYVMIAVILAVIALSLTMDSFLIPIVFLASIGVAIVYNMGTNLFLGQISYLTKAIAAVLQLGVTMDYSIFLWHSYEDARGRIPDKRDAMAEAISETITAVIGSSVTTIAGFIALCFMSFTLGLDMGLVMAKGVLIGVICCVTVLPSMILVLDRPLTKTRHKALLPDFRGIGGFVTKNFWIALIVFLVLLVPAFHGYTHTSVYYNLDSTLPESFESIQSNQRLQRDFDLNGTHLLMVSADLKDKDVQSLVKEIKAQDGVKWVLGLNSIKGAAIPEEFIPDSAKEALSNEHWQLLAIGSAYKVASDEVNAQCDAITAIAKEYDADSMLIGEAPGTKDLIRITDQDFNTVSTVSIGVIAVIILLVFGSISIPFVLVAVIEFGIFINLGIPCYTGTLLPFIASIIISTIQLGSTVDYGILMTTRYLKDRTEDGMVAKEAIADAVQNSVRSIMVSAISFFSATFGVGLYSNIDMISSLCVLMARGALISMACVIFLLPAFLRIFDPVIMHTTWRALKNRSRNKGSISGEEEGMETASE